MFFLWPSEEIGFQEASAIHWGYLSTVKLEQPERAPRFSDIHQSGTATHRVNLPSGNPTSESPTMSFLQRQKVGVCMFLHVFASESAVTISNASSGSGRVAFLSWQVRSPEPCLGGQKEALQEGARRRCCPGWGSPKRCQQEQEEQIKETTWIFTNSICREIYGHLWSQNGILPTSFGRPESRDARTESRHVTAYPTRLGRAAAAEGDDNLSQIRNKLLESDSESQP